MPENTTSIVEDVKSVALPPQAAGSGGSEAPETELPKKPWYYKLIVLVVAIALAFVSAVPLANIASDPATHQETYETLTKSEHAVEVLVATSAGMAVALSLLPDDIGSSIADKLADISGDLAIVLAAILLEKYLLTLVGLVAFRFIVPIGVLLIALSIIFNKTAITGVFRAIGLKLTLFALALFFAIPCGIAASNMIEETYLAQKEMEVNAIAEVPQEGENSEASQAQQNEGETSNAASEVSNGEATLAETSDAAEAESDRSGWLGGLIDRGEALISDFSDTVSNVADDVSEAASNAVNAITDEVNQKISEAEAFLFNLMESFAMLIVLNCLIPLLVIAFAFWLANLVLGTSFRVPDEALHFGSKVRQSAVASIKERKWKKK